MQEELLGSCGAAAKANRCACRFFKQQGHWMFDSTKDGYMKDSEQRIAYLQRACFLWPKSCLCKWYTVADIKVGSTKCNTEGGNVYEREV